MPALDAWASSAYEPLLSHFEKRLDAQTALQVNATQRTTIIVACVYAVVIMILWNFPILNYIIYPFKLLTVSAQSVTHAGCMLNFGARDFRSASTSSAMQQLGYAQGQGSRASY